MSYHIILHVFLMAQCLRSQDTIKSQEELVHILADPMRFGHIESEKVLRVMLQVDRKYYVDQYPYDDVAVSVGYGASFATATVAAIALETLKPKLLEGHVALDAGCGTGYMAVLMALMVGETGRVVGIDHIPELVNKSIQNVMKDKPYLLESGRLKFIVGDLRNGTPNDGPYDAIHVGALIKEHEKVPPALLQQLKSSGRLVIPVNRDVPPDNFNELLVVNRAFNDRIVQSFKDIYYEPHCEYLTDKDTQIARNFTPDLPPKCSYKEK